MILLPWNMLNFECILLFPGNFYPPRKRDTFIFSLVFTDVLFYIRPIVVKFFLSPVCFLIGKGKS